MMFLVHRLQVFLWTAFYRTVGPLVFTKMGRGCIFEGWIDFPQRGGRILLGDGVRICRMVELSVTCGAELRIGNGVFIGRGMLINAQELVEIGHHSQVAEYSAIHDNDHAFSDAKTLIRDQGMVSKPVLVGADVWVGAQSMLVAGATVPDGCVVGAKTLVTSKIQIEPYSIIVGSPGRIVGSRN